MIMVQSTPENEHKYFQKSGCYFFVLPISLMLLLLMASVFNWFGWLILSPFILVLIFLVYGSRHAILYRNTPALTLNEEGLTLRQGWDNRLIKIRWQDIKSIAQINKPGHHNGSYYDLRIQYAMPTATLDAHPLQVMWIALEPLKGEVYDTHQTILRYWKRYRMHSIHQNSNEGAA